jgi:hypothetical protein
MENFDHNKLIKETYKLAVEGKRITVPFLQKELDIKEVENKEKINYA